ncbi:glutathionylspermidine synthase family protein [Metabacillus litoralis]|uniref:glutathionylspermidine synthase family protein n=1 Tax=Metabacillus litoralis TaxID=152268 RepID=UPI001CFEB3D7|nr:glutathionylspermidine synthase family protein [Metabacillus litoralis]
MSQVFNKHNHIKKRAEIYNQISSFWHDLNDNEYALYDIEFIKKQELENIQLVTERVGKIFFKIADLLRDSSDETLLQLDIPKSALPYIRHRALPVETIIARVDLVQTSEGLKVLELNSDTPTFEKEVFHVNGHLCREFGAIDPNDGLVNIVGKEMRKALGEALHRTKCNGHPHIVFTSHDQNEEDKLTTQFLMETSNVSAKYVPLHKLSIKKDEGLYDDQGNKIDVLYRQTYPLEHLVEDVSDETEEQIGVQLIELVYSNKLIMLNPISAFLLQSKAVQAVIWGMKEVDSSYFTVEEKQWINDYFLPTYLEEDVFLDEGWKYVKKPSFGREGDTVSIYHGTKKLLEDRNHSYEHSLPVYQKYVDLPSKDIRTVNGIKEAKILIGSFLINGKACGIGLRAGSQITDNHAYFLPVGIKQERRDFKV